MKMNKETINQITDLVDKALNEISGRAIVSTAEMTDLLLDIRLHIMLDQESTTPSYL
jgi:hypothetical protein